MIAKGILGLTVLTAVPAAAAILGGREPVGLQPARVLEAAGETSSHEKDQRRVPTLLAATDAPAAGAPLVQLAHAYRPEAGRMPPPMPGNPPPPPFLQMPPFPPSEGPGVLPPASQAACEEEVSRKSALVGYFKSKLRLQDGSQREAWQKLEQAAGAAMEKLHAACDQLTAETPPSPDAVGTLDVVIRKLSADVEFLQAIREPLRGLYQQLSPKQRAMLQPPGAPGSPF
jgi:hypothetical protein